MCCGGSISWLEVSEIIWQILQPLSGLIPVQIALLFPFNFWGSSDMFGHVASSTPTRGEYFLFYSYAVFSGGPLLIALVSGAAAYEFEQIPAAEATARVMQVLRSIFEPKGVDVPSPLQVRLA